FACEHEGVVPDLLCLGKGLSAGMPISACMGKAEVMDCWPTSHGEALHTQTFLGHPASCAAALAALQTIDREGLVERAQRCGLALLERLQKACRSLSSVVEVRGLGMMIGIECTRPEQAERVTRRALERGVIVLPSGPEGRVVSLTPPLCIGPQQLDLGTRVLIEALAQEEVTSS
ncbi:aminotransferase class III-fold pyridoxal phosphate-dependent enzyme, partial [Myxococcota bacterium]|nr:aminotransferase class III-fold pyridoxal phosphate-dependent enzyme [Myxococcota bacterium]